MPDIRHRVGIAAEPMRVFEALTTLEGVQGWWDSRATGGAGEGETFEFSRNRLTVLEADPSVVRWSYAGPAADWVGTEIIFRLEWRERQTFVIFTHAGWREPVEFMHHCSTKWATFLLSLKARVEKGEGWPHPHDMAIELNG